MQQLAKSGGWLSLTALSDEATRPRPSNLDNRLPGICGPAGVSSKDKPPLPAANAKHTMKHRFLWPSALALAITSGSAKNTYRILGSTDASSWQTVVEDIPGKDGLVERTLDVSAGPQALFLTVGAIP